jgi:hypothetical protein
LILTSGYGGFPPPIEMRAHDSIVYVGDMLAFCFRAFSVEADVARSLLNFEPVVEEKENEDDTEQDEKEVKLAEEEAEYLLEKPIAPIEMLNQSMSELARPLMSRIEQVVSTLAKDLMKMMSNLTMELMIWKKRERRLERICRSCIRFVASFCFIHLRLKRQNWAQPVVV